MQREIDNEVQLGKTVSAFDTNGQLSSIDRTASKFINATEKVQKIKRLINTGEYATDLSKYIPKMLNLVFQGMIENIDTKEQVANISYKDMENLEFQIMLTNYTNLLYKLLYKYKQYAHKLFNENKKETNEDADIDTDLIPVNIFFAHLIKEINITMYGNDKQLMQTFPPYEIYQYSDAMLKYLPEKALKKIKKTMLHSNKTVSYNKSTTDMRTYHTITPDAITHDNLDDRIDTFQNQIKNESVYTIPLRYFTDIGKINYPLKIGF